jgi:hypothetical protein
MSLMARPPALSAPALFSNVLENTPIKGQNLSHWMYVSKRTAKTVKMETLYFGNPCRPGPGCIGPPKPSPPDRSSRLLRSWIAEAIDVAVA